MAIEVVKVVNKEDGNQKVHEILRKIVDSQTLLALSGGTSPDYRKMIVEPGDILPGAVCVADERWAESIHEHSNEYLMRSQGLTGFLKQKGIGFHNIQWHGDIISDECDYDGFIEKLFQKFQKKVGVMGVGTNLHTAGIFPYSAAVSASDYVVSEEVDDQFPLRISLTLKALGEFDSFIILLFGKEKRNALEVILDENENDMQKYPAIFYRKCVARSYLITDIAI